MTHAPLRTLAIALSLALAACQAESAMPTTAEIEAQLTQPNGGYTLTPEDPAFGQATLLASQGLLESQPAITDVMAGDPAVVALAAPETGARRFVVFALWGQPRPDADVPTYTDWSGSVSVSRGAVLARRAVRFEAPHDQLLPRTDPKVLGFTSYTQPHHDGLLLEVLDDPSADATASATMTFTLAALAEPLVIPFDELGTFRQVRRVDDLGNVLLVAATEIPAGACRGGLVLGRWHQVREDLGVVFGQWVGAGGELHGHLKGVYGQRPDGDRVFFGKYLGAGGEARGILRGTYGDGQFQGEWIGQTGPRGQLRGVYRTAPSGARLHGLLVGGWVQTDCSEPDLPAE